MAERVLITGARAPAALDLARCFAAAGLEVHVSDCVASRMASFSRAVTKVHRYPSPRHNFAGFARAIKDLVDRLQPQLVIPTCEEVFFLSAVNLPGDIVFAPNTATLRQLHSKAQFAHAAAALGLATPNTTRVESAEALSPFLDCPESIVCKPEYSRFGAHTLISPSREAMRALRPTPASAWLVQPRIIGEEVSFYAASVDSRPVAFSAYKSVWRFDGGAGYAFEGLDAALHDRLLQTAEALSGNLIPRGQFACDVMIDDVGTPWLLECNPRATSGVHLFDRRAELANAMLGRVDTIVLAGDAAPRHVGPALWTYGLAEALTRDRLQAWRARRRQSGDVISAPGDHAPIAGALIDTMQLSIGALARGKRLTEMATADIEWNGEAL